MANKSNPPNRGGSGPAVRKQSGNKGPIVGNLPNKSGGGPRPWGLGKGTSKSMNFGKNVKKS